MSTLQCALVVSRFLHFASCMFVFGASAVSLWLREMADQPQHRVVETVLKGAVILCVISALLWFACVAAAMAGDWSRAADPDILETVLFNTEFGTVWGWRIVVSLLLAIAAFWGLPQRPLVLTLLAAALLATIALTGHASMDIGDRGDLHRATDAVHLLAGGYWIGGVAMLPLALRGRDAEAALRILNRFSAFGIVAVVLVLLSGIGNAVFIIHGWPHLLASVYGEILLAKVALAGVMVTLACLNRWVLMPGLRQASSLAALKSSIGVEIVVGALILLAASVLGTVAPPAPM
ncbi:MAG: copper homeostasis membrane protein CopD [Alphaproteobacteria bacterium]|nr:copper homeostasis membrane protein CopD [Alphaproteobacteria bacterium]